MVGEVYARQREERAQSKVRDGPFRPGLCPAYKRLKSLRGGGERRID